MVAWLCRDHRIESKEKNIFMVKLEKKLTIPDGSAEDYVLSIGLPYPDNNFQNVDDS